MDIAQKRQQAKDNSETVIGREIRDSFSQGSCRRDQTCRFLHSDTEWRKMDAMEKGGAVATILSLRGCRGDRTRQ